MDDVVNPTQSTLKMLLMRHTELDRKIDEGDASSDVRKLAQELHAVEQEIHRGQYVRGTPITSVALYTLSNKTLKLAEQRLQVELRALLSGCVNPTSREYAEKKNELDAVVRELKKRRRTVPAAKSDSQILTS